jgi:hypothetical protein
LVAAGRSSCLGRACCASWWLRGAPEPVVTRPGRVRRRRGHRGRDRTRRAPPPRLHPRPDPSTAAGPARRGIYDTTNATPQLRALASPSRRSYRTRSGIMWVTFGHLRPSGHIMPDHAGDRGAVFLVLAPHDHPAYQPCAGVHDQRRRCINIRAGRLPARPWSGSRTGRKRLITARRAADMRASPGRLAGRRRRTRTIVRSVASARALRGSARPNASGNRAGLHLRSCLGRGHGRVEDETAVGRRARVYDGGLLRSHGSASPCSRPRRARIYV